MAAKSSQSDQSSGRGFFQRSVKCFYWKLTIKEKLYACQMMLPGLLIYFHSPFCLAHDF